jgi:hypothetical protein
VLNTREEAYRFIDDFEVPERLKIHIELVSEVADLLIKVFEELELSLDFEFIRIGVVVHDIGKVVHFKEIVEPGSEHEPEGERMLLEKGVSSRLARVCMSHARWPEMICSMEELIIALSDTLWKGKRIEALETLVIARISEMLKVERWDIFLDMDMKFEEIAADGHKRLQRSIIS